MKLNLGCGNDPRPVTEGWENVDRVPGPNVDRVWDLDKRPWPWASGSVDRVLMDNVLEHLEDPMAVATEVRRVLRQGGTWEVIVPHAWGLGACRADHRHLFTTSYFNGLSTNKGTRRRAQGLMARPWFRVRHKVMHRLPLHGTWLGREWLMLRPHVIRFELVADHE